MKIFKRLSQLSSIALAGLLYVSATHAAVAAQAAKPLAEAVESSSHSPIVQAYYYHHGHRYSYRYHGMYYNHRRYGGGRWRYY
jgi:hypothetical protein